MALMLGAVLLLLVVVTATAGDSEETGLVQVTRRVLKSGFHRELVSVVSGRGPAPQLVLLRETLPAGLYADPYELSGSEFASRFQADFLSRVDVEAPASRSAPLRLLLFIAAGDDGDDDAGTTGAPTWTATVSLPVHLRYHAPAQLRRPPRAHVLIDGPLVLLPCDSPGRPCEGASPRDVTEASCSATNRTVCRWRRAAIVTQEEGGGSPLALSVPVGSLDHEPAVLALTLITALGCCLLLLLQLLPPAAAAAAAAARQHHEALTPWVS
ncbi:phosphatidylinositol-glycan biosynthesis class X protein isoform X2 [Lethenteron reissneri]|uniref:phosphatidylinositol-glycan biosynthesis class X protein isoform X2 n=1 Tax=Lethenteron reissneri TaxID=7753 RepID=UPI002AB5F8F2|nr:phosphatidylinositol-glycan biosynthesis class X protein isoform X2 [Lethenteron reissneri]